MQSSLSFPAQIFRAAASGSAAFATDFAMVLCEARGLQMRSAVAQGDAYQHGALAEISARISSNSRAHAKEYDAERQFVTTMGATATRRIASRNTDLIATQRYFVVQSERNGTSGRMLPALGCFRTVFIMRHREPGIAAGALHL